MPIQRPDDVPEPGQWGFERHRLWTDPDSRRFWDNGYLPTLHPVQERDDNIDLCSLRGCRPVLVLGEELEGNRCPRNVYYPDQSIVCVVQIPIALALAHRRVAGLASIVQRLVLRPLTHADPWSIARSMYDEDWG